MTKTFIADGMAKVREAVAQAPAHEELYAACEVMLTLMFPADPVDEAHDHFDEVEHADIVDASAEEPVHDEHDEQKTT